MEKNTFARKFGRFVISYRWLIIFANILVLAALFAGMSKRVGGQMDYFAYMEKIRNHPLETDPSRPKPGAPIFDTDYRAFFHADNPDLVAYEEFQKVYAEENNIIVSVVARNGDLFTEKNLESLKRLTDSCWTVPFVNGVVGLTNFNYTKANQDELIVEDFIASVPRDAESLRNKKSAALSDPLIPKFLLSKDARVTQITLRVIAPSAFPQANEEAKGKLDGIIAGITAANPDLEAHLGGTVILNTAFADFSNKDFSTVVPAMYGIIIFMLAFLLRSFWGVVLPMFVLLTSVMFPILLFVGCLGYSITPLSSNVINIMVSIAIAETIHILLVFFQGLRSGMDKRQAIHYTMEKNLAAVFFTNATTAIGFFSTIWIDIPPFQDLGAFAGAGTIYAFFASVMTVPALLAVLPMKAPKSEAKRKAIANPEKWDWLVGFVVSRQKGIRIASLVLALGAVAGLFAVQIDDNTMAYFSKGSEFRKSSEYIDNNIIGVNLIEFSFKADRPQGVTEPSFLKKIEKFQAYVGAHPEFQITHVAGVTDVVKRLNMTMNGDDPFYYRIPDRDSITSGGDTLSAAKLISQYLLLYTLSLPQGMDLTNQLNLDNSQTRVTAFMRSLSSWKQMAVVDSLNAWLAKEMPEVRARAVGVPVMFGRLSKIAVPMGILSMVTSILFIIICMVVTFRSFKIGLWSMIPNIWPILLIFGTVGALGFSVNLAIAVVGEITLGIVVDDTIHFILKFVKYMKSGKTQVESLRLAYADGAEALAFTSIILVLGFGSLVFSDFAPTKTMGILGTAILVLAIFADLIMLPAWIFYFSREKQKPGVALGSGKSLPVEAAVGARDSVSR